ncbi:conserved hypothetical protein [Nitrosococcus halophilus Nc 4]|uniref:Uncharacterized protein n=1 Tax=Nitrosococcus halophilus (strain Nc4) TaxID=472759 RepID=D5BYG8_NITHN|nr:DUF5906 domain-containing protein [Nitrosococcus halophilus]ADE14151.1 conserved hypothetical protein [Nitrosococcus halophilus Nc 4]
MLQNYDSVLAQLRDAGLIIRHLDTSGRFKRCKVEGDREKRGWYILHEISGDSGPLIVGSFGIWRGNDNNAQKIQIERSEISEQQQKALAERIRADRKKAEAARRREAERAALRAQKMWAKCLPTDQSGTQDYLSRKGIQAHGVRFTPSGALVIPMMDIAGRIHGLQFILSRQAHAKRIDKFQRDKEYWPPGLQKQGHFFQVGGVPNGVGVIVEGYATGASIYEATGLPVFVAFDAHNLQPVALALAKRYKTVKWLIAADDDNFQKCRECKLPVKVSDGDDCPHCGEPHGKKNAGVDAAYATALAIDGAVAVPRFEDQEGRWQAFEKRGKKTTDFNDLHLAEGLQSVRRQIEEIIESRKWRQRIAGPARSGDESPGEEGTLVPVQGLDELLDRFSMVYGHGGTAFDHREHMLVAMSDVRDLCIRRELYRAWMEHPDRKIVRVDEVGFDPAGRDTQIKCNLWEGWPTEPKAGNCQSLLELLEYMCGRENQNSQALLDWVLKWLAYPIQNPGAKMRTALVIHGPQGTGKNLFFECIMQIYGRYGRIIDQSAVEDKFNDWASKKLFLIADEVIARSELFHIKNKLKGLITGEWIRINPKNIGAYEERNHVNMVFLSNERMPVVLEEDDRRHCIIWTPEKLPKAVYDEVAAEIRDGGVEALHHYLLNLDLTGFNEHTRPPHTEAKQELIELSMDTCTEFYHDLADGEFGDLHQWPVLSDDLFDLYRSWCSLRGHRSPASQRRFNDILIRKHGAQKLRKQIMTPAGRSNQRTFLIFRDAVDKPPDESEAVWYGRCVEKVRYLISDWKESRPFRVVK